MEDFEVDDVKHDFAIVVTIKYDVDLNCIPIVNVKLLLAKITR